MDTVAMQNPSELIITDKACALDLTFEWAPGFVYCHSRSTWTLNEDPRSNLCETRAHSSWAADTCRHSPLVETLSEWLMFKYSSWTRVPHTTFIKWIPKGLPVRYAERNRSWDVLFHHYVPSLFLGPLCSCEKDVMMALVLALKQ